MLFKQMLIKKKRFLVIFGVMIFFLFKLVILTTGRLTIVT